jgi:electron transport complex protein RnfC
MIKRRFFSIVPPRLVYDQLTGALPPVARVVPKARAVLLAPVPFTPTLALTLKVGDEIKTGQKLEPYGPGTAYAVSPVSGKVAGVQAYVGTLGKACTRIDIESTGMGSTDETFAAQASALDSDGAKAWLAALPGQPAWDDLHTGTVGLDAVVILAVESDLLTITNQYAAMARTAALKAGIAALKSIAGVDDMVLAVPRDSIQGLGHLGARAIPVDNHYPSALPRAIMAKVLGRPVPAGQTCRDQGVAFFTAEAVAALGAALETKTAAVAKLITVTGPDGKRTLVEAPIGTPVADILDALAIPVTDKDRVVLGGPMTGTAIFDLNHPILADTDAIMVQRGADVSLVTDYPCINCGECVRACPVNIQVNMLVRYLEASRWQDAEQLYDLSACIDCGLCSYVCTAHIPVYQYIRLGKYELGRMVAAEVSL